jgi:phenylpropionate dioxygenase-like ring-hydroxylating dioxygenase large terminal subunit
MFVKNAWYAAAEPAEIGRTLLRRVFINEPVVMFRREDGTPVALEDRCCHRRVPLSKGRLIGDTLQCGYHGLRYESSGQCIEIPGQTLVPAGARVRSYPLVELHGWVWIWMGEAKRADAALVPDFHEAALPGYATIRGYTHIDCHYLLMVDNLLDLSHLAFVHSSSIGSTADTNPTLKLEQPTERTIRLTRAVTDLAIAPIYRQQGFTKNIDQTKIMTLTAPSSIVIDILSAERDGGPMKTRSVILNGVTPETDRSSHYFWGSARDFDIANTEWSASLKRQTAAAFDEDKDMLEAQQRNIALDPSASMIDVRGDAGGVQGRKLVDRMLAEERGRAQAAE